VFIRVHMWPGQMSRVFQKRQRPMHRTPAQVLQLSIFGFAATATALPAATRCGACQAA